MEKQELVEVPEPDIRQYLPFYGIYRVLRDMSDGKPTIADGGFDGEYYGIGILAHASAYTALIVLAKYIL